MATLTMDGQWDAGNGIPIGTEVFTADGAHLGVVVDGDAYDLVVEEGWFLVRDYPDPRVGGGSIGGRQARPAGDQRRGGRTARCD